MAQIGNNPVASILDLDAFELATRALDAYPEPVPLVDFGPYRIEQRIDKGGMGEVWRAYDVAAQRHVAIKIPRYLSDTKLRERFVREVQSLGKLEHPSIARLYDHGVCPDGTPYFAMEFLDGMPVDEYCREHDLSADARVRLFQRICGAVQYAHSRLVVHRDLKPSNILITPDGSPKVLDFGIAKELESFGETVTLTGTDLRFTRAYASPEQIRNEPVGTHMDVYALGVMLYELLARKLPHDFDGCTPGQADALVTGDKEPERPSTSPKRVQSGKAAWNDLDLLCLTAMKKDLSRRYSSVFELSQDVDHYLRGEPLRARPDSLPYRLNKFVTRNRRPITATALLVALVTGLVAFFTLRLEKERDRANQQAAIVTLMNGFLSDDLLGRTDPFRTGQSNESFLEVVSRASPQIDTKFARQSIVAARLHQTLAMAFDNRSDFQQARREYQRAVELFLRTQGELSQDAALTRLRLARMEARTYQPASVATATSILDTVERTLSRIPHPRDEFAVRVPQTRGYIAVAKTDMLPANSNFSAALRAAQRVFPAAPVEQARILQLVAFSYMRLGDAANAEPMLRSTAAAYATAYGPDSPEVLRARVNLAQCFLVGRKYADNIRETTLIYPALVSKLGQNHELTINVLGTRAASEGSLGRWDDAIRDDLLMHKLAVEKGLGISRVGLASLSDAALSQCQEGRLAEGESNARTAYNQAKNAFRPRDALTGGIAYTLAFCLIYRNKLDEASSLLAGIDVAAVGQMAGDPDTVRASIELSQADIAARRGDYTLAKGLVDKDAPVFDRPDSDLGGKLLLQRLRKTLAAHPAPPKS